MEAFLSRVIRLIPIAILAAASAKAAVVNVNALLKNPSFENGNAAGGCPNDWVCGGSPAPGFTSYDITTAQYNPLFIPDGTHAGSSPVPVEGSGSAAQVTSSTYAFGDTYRLTFWVGTPLTLPIDDVTPVGTAGLFQASFLGLINEQLDLKEFALPTPGNWTQYVYDFTPTAAQAGKTIGVKFRVESALSEIGGSGNNRIVNLDVVGGDPTPQTPEPSSLALLGLGLAGLGTVRRFRKKV